MRNLILILTALCCAVAIAQPQTAKKAYKSVFTLRTYTADRLPVGTAFGFFTDSEGEAVSVFQPFKGAARAEVQTADGKTLPVEYIYGANDAYDVVRFKVNTSKAKVVALATDTTRAADGTHLWLAAADKSVHEVSITKVENFLAHYAFYTLSGSCPSDCAGLPLLDAAGRVTAVMQRKGQVAENVNFAVSASLADSLSVSGLSLNDATLRATNVKKALPEQLEQAKLTLYFAANTLDSTAYAQLVDDFIVKFPAAIDGYISKADLAIRRQDYPAVDNTFGEALSKAEPKAEVHFNYARAIYRKVVYQPQPSYEKWTLDAAHREVDAAIAADDQPLYRHQKALISFAQHNYADAAQMFHELSTTPLRSAELFYEEANCYRQLSDTTRYLALLDSAVATYSRPLLKEAAPYLLTRATARYDCGRFRDAVADLNDYEALMRTAVNDQFYYLRYQAERSGRLFQQALDDIGRALQKAPDEQLYYAEKASLEVYVGLYDEALTTSKTLIDMAPEGSDGYLFYGYALCMKGNTKEGLQYLQKALERGDKQAERLIERFSQK